MDNETLNQTLFTTLTFEDYEKLKTAKRKKREI